MKLKNPKDFYAGLLFMILGLVFAVGATRYSVGTTAKMGPGYFPLILGGLLAIFGAVSLIRGLLGEGGQGEVGPIPLRSGLLVFGSIAAFAVLLKTAGLVVSVFAIILMSSLASQESHFKESLISAVGLCLASLAIFVYGLNLLLPVLPAWGFR